MSDKRWIKDEDGELECSMCGWYEGDCACDDDD